MVLEFPPFLNYLIVGILMYVIIFISLQKFAFVKNDSMNALIAFLTTGIVAFSGVVTYIITYSVTFFTIIIFLFFLIFLIFGFLGIDKDVFFNIISKKFIIIAIMIFVLFVIVKAFFGVNNAFDLNDPQDNQTVVDTSFNTGVDDVTGVKVDDKSWFESFSIDSDLLGAVVFLVLIGGAIFLIGN